MGFQSLWFIQIFVPKNDYRNARQEWEQSVPGKPAEIVLPSLNYGLPYGRVQSGM